MRTAARGTLLFDASKSERELGMRYTDIRVAFTEAIDFITTAALPELPADTPDAAQGLLGAEGRDG